MNLVYEANVGKFHFMAIYIAEAHAADEWPLGNFVCVNQHTTIEQRVNAAKSFIANYNFKIPTYVDTIDNSFNKTYAAWPDRYYIIDKNIIKSYGVAVYGLGFDRSQLVYELKKFGGDAPDAKFINTPSTVDSSGINIKEFEKN